jgi:hypothetical protein
MIIIGIGGKMGSGKNYVSDHYIVPTLIDLLKKKESNMILIPYYFSFGTCVKMELYGRDCNNVLSFSNLFLEKTNQSRTLLREYANNCGRDTFRKDMWIRELQILMDSQILQLSILNEQIKSFCYVPLFIIQDVRFPNEYEFIKKFNNNLLIRVEAFDRHSEKCNKEDVSGNDISETSLDNISFPYVIYNNLSNHDTIQDQVDKILQHFISKI